MISLENHRSRRVTAADPTKKSGAGAPLFVKRERKCYPRSLTTLLLPGVAGLAATATAAGVTTTTATATGATAAVGFLIADCCGSLHQPVAIQVIPAAGS